MFCWGINHILWFIPQQSSVPNNLQCWFPKWHTTALAACSLTGASLDALKKICSFSSSSDSMPLLVWLRQGPYLLQTPGTNLAANLSPAVAPKESRVLLQTKQLLILGRLNSLDGEVLRLRANDAWRALAARSGRARRGRHISAPDLAALMVRAPCGRIIPPRISWKRGNLRVQQRQLRGRIVA